MPVLMVLNGPWDGQTFPFEERLIVDNRQGASADVIYPCDPNFQPFAISATDREITVELRTTRSGRFSLNFGEVFRVGMTKFVVLSEGGGEGDQSGDRGMA